MRYRWTLLDAGPLLLDGGGMFGVIPKVVWSRFAGADDRNRIRLRHNCLLLESTESDPALGRPRRALIETGSGDKLDAKMRGIFGFDGRDIHVALSEAGADPAEIDDVLVTHLHFDHAGGLTRRCRAGETPDWIAPDDASRSGDASEVKVSFPNATVHVQALEWRTAVDNSAVMTRTYYRDHLLPIEGRVRQAESPTALDHDRIPRRGQLPRTPLEDRWTEVAPGLRVFLTPGHTWGQQAVHFTDDRGREVVFVPDVMPTAMHVGAAYSLSYDVEPYMSMITKHWLLHESSERGWLLVLDHDPATPLVRARQDGDWFALDPAERP